MPIQFIDLDGTEPATPGNKDGESRVNEKKGTGHYYNWKWTIGSDKKGLWVQGSTTEFQNGSVATKSSNHDNTKEYFPEVQVGDMQLVLSLDENSIADREKDFRRAFGIGVHTTGVAEAAGEGLFLMNHFMQNKVFAGGVELNAGDPFLFTTNSDMSDFLKKDANFESLSSSFETKAMEYYKQNQSLEGFNRTEVLIQLGMPQIRETIFMHTVMGGTQQWNVQIRNISADRIQVMWTVRDRFSAGTDDAKSGLPGLSSLYWL